MGKGIGVILLIFGILIFYFGTQNPDAGRITFWVGGIIFVVGALEIAFSRPKQPQPFR